MQPLEKEYFSNKKIRISSQQGCFTISKIRSVKKTHVRYYHVKNKRDDLLLLISRDFSNCIDDVTLNEIINKYLTDFENNFKTGKPKIKRKNLTF